LELLLQRVRLEDLVVQAGTQVRRSGHELRGPCPLHGGDNPTAFAIFTGNDGSQQWHCFSGCQSGGDALDFVMRWKQFDFKSAVQYLADYAGVSLEQIGLTAEVAQELDKQRQRRQVLAEAVRYFRARLAEHDGAMAYLRGRGFNAETIAQSGWGYTDSGIGLLQHLQSKHADIDLARQMGLIRQDGSDFTANANGAAASPDGYVVYP
jgi:DNA primase